MKQSTCCLMLLSVSSFCGAQDKLPHVDEIVQRYDANGDRILTADEIAGNARYARQFARWDKNQDGQVSGKEIAAMRAKFGIAADGSMLGRNGNSKSTRAKLQVPSIAELTRVDGDHRPDQNQARQSAVHLPNEASSSERRCVRYFDRPHRGSVLKVASKVSKTP